jgi:hypothetical protein
MILSLNSSENFSCKDEINDGHCQQDCNPYEILGRTLADFIEGKFALYQEHERLKHQEYS